MTGRGLDVDGFDGNARVGLTMAVLDPVAFATLLLEDDHFVGLHVIQHFGGYGSTIDGRLADVDRVAGNEQDAVKREGITNVRLLAGNVKRLVLPDFILLAGNFDDCVHNCVRA